MGAQNIYYNDLDFSISIESLASLASPRAKQNLEPFIRQTDEKSRKHWNCPNTIYTTWTNKQTRLDCYFRVSHITGPGWSLSWPQVSQSAGLTLIRSHEARPSPVTGTVFRMRDKFTRIQPSLASSSSPSNNAGVAEREKIENGEGEWQLTR